MASISLEVTLSHFDDCDSSSLTELSTKMWSRGSDSEDIFLIPFKSLRLTARSVRQDIPASQYRLAAIFLPSAITDTVFDRHREPQSRQLVHGIHPPESKELSRKLLSKIHSFLVQHVSIKGIFYIESGSRAPADVILVGLQNETPSTLSKLLEATHCENILTAPQATLKVLALEQVTFRWQGDLIKSPQAASLSPQHFDIPTCPVCLHRIDPSRIGLLPPRSTSMCSKFCPLPTVSLNSSILCPNQANLRAWPSPSDCLACRVIEEYWKAQNDESNKLFCIDCAMQETLWVCLTCGFVGCGRYSNKHAAIHFTDTGHPFSLELATLRIWSYTDGEFAHRVDLLDCPSSPPRCRPWTRRSPSPAGGTSNVVAYNNEIYNQQDKHSKKAVMLGEEYEALLQSALEEQAQHYEGEISRLRAVLTAKEVDLDAMTHAEMEQTESLRQEILKLRLATDCTGRDLVDFQGQEADHRATSQRLLREQQITKNLLRQIEEELASKNQYGRIQIEELEQQIADLTANQRMMHQFAQDGELANSQIWGTSGETHSRHKTPKKGKKMRRYFRK